MEDNVQIKIKNMVKHYPIGNGKFTALRDISTEFSEGDFAGLVGPSGSGKTTLLNILGSLDVQSEGEVIVMDSKIKELSSTESAYLRREHIGFIFQSYNLLPVYSVYENVEFPLILLGIPTNKRKKMVEDALEWVELTDKLKSKPAQLSGGQSQRVAIARAMVKRPKLLLADEPTANLDADNSHNILKTMKKLNEELGTTFIFSTHDSKVIQYLKRKISLVDGRITNDEIF